MARGRILSKTISTDREVNLLDDGALAAWCLMIPHLDRDGLITGDVVLLWAEIAPRREHWRARMVEFVQRWQELDMIVVYEDPSQGPVLWLPNFRKHQKIEYRKEAPSLFVAPPGYARTDDGLVAAVDVQLPLDGFPTGLTNSRVTLDLLSTNSRVTLDLLGGKHQDQSNKQGKEQDQGKHQHQHQQQADSVPVFVGVVAAALVQVGIQCHSWQKIQEGVPDLEEIDVLAWLVYTDEQNAGLPASKRNVKNPAGFILNELQHGRLAEDRFYHLAEERMSACTLE